MIIAKTNFFINRSIIKTTGFRETWDVPILLCFSGTFHEAWDVVQWSSLGVIQRLSLGRGPVVQSGRDLDPAIKPGRGPVIQPGRDPMVQPGRDPLVQPGHGSEIQCTSKWWSEIHFHQTVVVSASGVDALQAWQHIPCNMTDSIS